MTASTLCTTASECLTDKDLTPVKFTVNNDIPPLVIASKGKALIPIVCPDVKYYRQVAVLLKKYLDKASGGDFAIVSQPPSSGRAIYLGPSKTAAVSAIFNAAQNGADESLTVTSIPEGIVLAGKDADSPNRLAPKPGIDINDRKQSRGTLFAAIEFLERLVGVRLYFPGIGIYVPDHSGNDLTIAPVSYSDAPAFNCRALGYGGGKDLKLIEADPAGIREWNLMSRLADTNMKEAWHTDANWHLVFGKTHPEYFAIRKDGSRAVGERGRFSAYRCYSSDAGLDAHISAIDTYLRTGEGKELFLREEFAPNKRYIHWGIADGSQGCACPRCKADPQVDWRYLLRLAQECKRRWPDKIVATLYYGTKRHIPDFIIRENPGNLLISPVRFGTSGVSGAFLKEQAAWTDADNTLKKLSELSAEKPYIWLHYPHSPRMQNSQNIPYMTPHYYQDFIRKNRDRISGMLFNGHSEFYSYALDALQLYIMYKISWNPDFDVDACIDCYCDNMFGPAAVMMKEYYHTIIDRWENVKWRNLPALESGDWAKLLPYELYWRETYPRDIRDRLEKLLTEGMAKTKPNTPSRSRMEFMVKGTEIFFSQGRNFDQGRKFEYTCHRWTPPSISCGTAAWVKAGIEPLELVRNDSGNPDKAVKGKIYISYDDTNLYIVGHVAQNRTFTAPPAGADLPRDSNLWDYDSLEIFLSTEQPGIKEADLSQRSQYHQLIISPYGAIWDGYKTEKMDSGTNINFKFAHTKLDQKHPARFFFYLAIPFSELHCIVPKDGSVWFANFYWNSVEEGKRLSYTWSGTGGHHNSARFGSFKFSE